jgi:hypothetical protein
LERYDKYGNEFLSHIVQVTGDEILVSFVIIETKEQSKQWLHTYSSKKPNKFKYILFICQWDYGSCFLGQEMSAYG